MTPSQHRTTAEALLTSLEAGPTGMKHDPSDADVLILHAHAHLAGTAGTGTHYEAADAALTAAKAAGTAYPSKLRNARAAVAHALLAD